ncbi:hypothetical protein [Isoptericola sp. G70]|uniref:hypothetical protein n=1 Tax=Isoptericola sp. G70 TaxID=3376633 RepID=UPI003A807F9C
MPTRTNGSPPTRRKKIETPVMIATFICIVLAGIGALTGFEVLGGLGPVPVLIVLIVAVFAVGAAMTVRRIGALRTASADRPKG